MMKKMISLTLVFILLMGILTGCGGTEETSVEVDNEQNVEETVVEEKEVPVIDMAWMFTMHHGAMLVSSAKGEDFKDSGIWLKPIVEKEQYELYKDGEKIALVNTIVTKGSSEAAVMLGQEKLDCALNSVTGMLSAKDQGTDVQILCPIHVDGIGMVFPPDVDLNGWEEVEEYIKAAENPVRIGYHSPVSAPRIIVETALRNSGINVTEDALDADADVLLVDLKGSSNLLSSFAGDQVDAWVGPSHFPEEAEASGIGNIALKLNEFPPEGQWYDFPCCVFAARKDSVEANPEVYEALVDLFTYTTDWMMNNKEETAIILADIIGASEEAIQNASIVYTTQVSDKWREGVGIYFEMLDMLGKFDGDLAGGNIDDIVDEFYNFQFIE